MAGTVNPRPRKRSLYGVVGLIIFAAVVAVMGTQAVYSYTVARTRIIETIEENSRQSIQALSKHLSNMIEAYAVNEYTNLVLAELERRGTLAIVVEDYNMGEILGQRAHVSGKIRDGAGNIVDYEPDDPGHARTLADCYFTARTDIFGLQGQALGTITVCNSDQAINSETRNIILATLVNTLVISITLIALLFLAMSRFLLRPISAIAGSVRQTDADGIPVHPAPGSATAELAALSDAVNHMVGSVRRSRASLRDSEFRWKFAVEGSGDGLWDWNVATNEVFFSRQWKSMLGYAEHEVENRIEEWEQRVHPDDLRNARTELQRHLDGETEIYINRHRVRCKEGNYRWILDRGIVVERAEDGTPLRMIGTHSDITEQVEHQKALEHSATHDSLTGLPNRFLFSELIQRAMHRCRRNDSLLALLYIDLDGFKEINDEYGHDAGDELLIMVAQRMNRLLRQEDMIARLGGDEFVIAISDLARNSEVIPLLKRLLHDLNQTVTYREHEEHPLQVSASIGVTFYPQAEPIGPEALLRQADHAMYESKASGRNQYRVFDIDASSSLREHQRMVSALQNAIRQDELELHYQPKVDMAGVQVLGFEALLRWNHPSEGLLYPDSFLPRLSQERELMLSLGRWVMETAFRQLSELRRAGYDVSMAINVSAHELRSPDTYGLLESLLGRYPEIVPDRVELELLEVSALEDIEGAAEVIRAWQRLGIRVALDDFGTGYSTLGYLKNLPVDTLKIDKSFVIDMLHDSASFSILEAAMGLARAFRCDVVAEGVESLEHGEMLVQLGCRIGQGYAIARPIAPAKVRTWLEGYHGQPQWMAIQPLHQRDWTVLYASVEHRNWVRMLRNYVDDPARHRPPELDPLHCRFGEWLTGEARTVYANDAVLTQVEALHASVHKQAAAVVAARTIEERHALVTEIEALHEQLLKALTDLYWRRGEPRAVPAPLSGTLG